MLEGLVLFINYIRVLTDRHLLLFTAWKEFWKGMKDTHMQRGSFLEMITVITINQMYAMHTSDYHFKAKVAFRFFFFFEVLELIT